MKTRIMTMLTALLLISIGAFAQQVSESDALQKAQAFMQGKIEAAGGSRRAPRRMQRVAKAAENDAFYIFNAEDNGGFVIVSGDERTEEILGYSTEGNIDLDKMPENMKALLKSYEEQINAIPADAKAELAMKPSRPAIAPMLDTFWGQGEPYNLHCPEIDGQRCVTGCVATALAQIMYYHKWPEDYTTDIPAYDYTLSSWNNESQSWDNPTAEALPATQFDWDKMNTVYLPNSSEESKEAVSKLMRYCGQAFWMEYGINESSASMGEHFRALVNKFGYSDKIELALYDYYSPTEWDHLIYNELQCHRPLIYSSSSFFGEHAFVCDGYDGDGYYHMNLGFDGNYNGWYLLMVLSGFHNLDRVAFGFSYLAAFQPSVIVGIQRPDDDATLPQTLTAAASLEYDNNEKVFKIDCYNLSDIERQFECGLRCYDIANGNIKFEHIGGMPLLAGHSASAAIPVSVCDFSEGVRYRLCPIWRQTGEDSWHILNAQSIEIIMQNGNITEFTRNGVSASIDVIGQLVEKSSNYVIVTIYNGEFDLKENVYVDIIDKSTGYQIKYDKYYACLAAGEQCKIKIGFRGDKYKEGEYEIRVIAKNTPIASKYLHISKKMDVAIVETPVFDWKSKTFNVLVVNNDKELSYDKAVWAYLIPSQFYYGQPISTSSPYCKDCQIIKSEKLHIEPGDSAWVTIPCNDANIDLLSSAVFVVCQNQDEERYESSVVDIGEYECWYWAYGKYFVSVDDGNMLEFTYKFLKVYDEFYYSDYDSGYSFWCYVIDDVSNICVVHQIHGFGDRVFVPGKVKHPVNGKWYSIIGLNRNDYIYNAKSVVIGENVTSLLGDRYVNTFQSYNEQLESLTFPASLNHLTNTTISLAAAPNLKRIYCKAAVPPRIESNGGSNNIHGILYEGQAQVFNHPSGETWIPTMADYSNITLYVPIGSRDAYAQAWSSFVNIVEMDVEDMPSTTVVLPGDANGDGTVSVTDVTMTISHILGQTPAGFNKDAVDINRDGSISVTDVTLIIDMILKQK